MSPRLRRFSAASLMLAGVAVGLGSALGQESARAQSRNPAPPAGVDPGGVPVAVFANGVDYTDPATARRLARDGEGDVIAWDFTDNDPKPFGKTDPRLARLLEMTGSMRVIIARGDVADPARAPRLTAFAVRTPAKIILTWDTAPGQPDWSLFLEGVRRFSDRLFIIPAAPDAQYGEARSLPNLLIAAASGRNGDVIIAAEPGSELEAAEAAASYAAAVAADTLSDNPGANPAAIKARLQALCGTGCRIGGPPQPR